MARIHLIARDNGRGLSHDILLLESTLRQLGHEVRATPAPLRTHGLPWRAWGERLRMTARWLVGRGPRRYDLGITLEHVHPGYLPMARRNALVPNPEWLSRRDRRQLDRFDAILCKTAVARETFADQSVPTRLIGFHSTDCRRPGIVRDRHFLHIAGASRMKGTERLLDVWRRHPEWPTLHVLHAPSAVAEASAPPAANIRRRVGYVDDIEDIRRLQNAHVFHLCLSEAEGWGHYIVEAMSCAAVVLTTDAAPMNELVGDDRGILVAAHEHGTLNAAKLWWFDETALEAAVERAIAMSDGEVATLGAAARAWFDANGEGFRRHLGEAMDALL